MKKILLIILPLLLIVGCEKFKTPPLAIKVLDFNWLTELRTYPAGNDTWFNSKINLSFMLTNICDEELNLFQTSFNYRPAYIWDSAWQWEDSEKGYADTDKYDISTIKLNPGESIVLFGNDSYREHLSGYYYWLSSIRITWNVENDDNLYEQTIYYNYYSEYDKWSKDYIFSKDGIKKIVSGKY